MGMTERKFWVRARLKLWMALYFLLAGQTSGLFAQNTAFKKCISVPVAGVASAHIEASQVGRDILKNGGNAADAATAVAFALAVVYPQAGNLGGGGFLVYRDSSAVYVLDFRETAPAAASRDMYLDREGHLQAEKSRLGGLAVGVPGTVRGFFRFHRKFGRLSWPQVIAPAIRLAERGFKLSEFQVNAIREAAADFRRFPRTAEIFLPGGTVPEAGEKFVQKNLARTLKSIALHGDEAFYQGQIARQIVKAVRENGGILGYEDLKNYRTVEREPVEISYRDFTIYAVPPPSSGSVVLAGILNSLKMADFSRFPFHSAQQIGLFAELEKRFYALRNQLLGDPAFVKMPLQRLLSPAFAAEIFSGVDYRHPEPADKISAAQLLGTERLETTHFSVVDEAERAVSVTYSLNGSFGSKLVAGNTGILLNNEMDDFAAKPGQANMYGLVQGEANSISPGKRMLSSMTPVIVTRNEQLAGVLGSPGGPRIITTVLQVLVNLIDYRMPLREAVAAGRFHDQWLPDSVYYEPGVVDAANLKKLEHWGYHLVKRNSIGDVQAIWRDGELWDICSDPRGNGLPSGY